MQWVSVIVSWNNKHTDTDSGGDGNEGEGTWKTCCRERDETREGRNEREKRDDV